MAVLAPPNWQQLYPSREPTMDVPATNNINSRQRSSPANDNQQIQHQHPQQLPPQHQPAFSYPVQQPQGSWTPSITAAPFYPSFYQNHQQQQPQQPYPPQVPQQSPYFDPTNAQLAQWAYQQMMFNAQHGFPPQQRNASANDYFSQNQIPPAFNPFPSGTPPPHQSHRGGAGDHQQQSGQQGQFNGFHPYRRPSRQPQPHSTDVGDRRPGPPGPPNPPYKRPEASGSTSSLNSSASQRQRTNSNQSGHSGQNTPSSVNGSVRGRNVSPSVPSNRNSPSPASSSGSTATGQLRVPHHRASSSSSSNSARPSGISPAPPSSTTTTSSATASSTPAVTSTPTATPRPVRPSPLSQGNFTANERRMSRDDSDPMLDPTPSASMLRSGGLKGRLRRALSFNAAQALKEEQEASDDDDESIKASSYGSSSKLKSKTPAMITSATGKSGGPAQVRGSTDGTDDGASTATVQTKKKGRAASLFNARLNVSTDNISLSSTVSSASVMIRKLGSMGKLAKRNSLAGITSLFKDKDKDKSKKKDKKGTAKAEASEASVSHVTAELDRSSSGDWTVGADMNGLSPAAKLARQHTLKSNAEAAARAKAAQEAAAANSASSNSPVNGVNGAGVPTWDRNTATRQGSASPVKGGGAGMRVNDDGTRVLVEDEDEESDEGHYDGPQQAGQSFHAAGWGDDDEDWDGEGDGDEDTTIRVGLERTSLDDEGYDEIEPWAMNVRRSEERARRPAKGILKYAESYDQQVYLTETPNPNRVRSNSYNSHSGQTELGPLARIPSPDPDHIDGLHKHPHSSSHALAAPSLPPLTFDTSMSLESPTKEPSTPTNASHNQNPLAPHPPEKSNAIFNHPNLNSSAPTLSMTTTTMTSTVMLTHRSATAPSKRLAFANNLSVYDTFPASVYDRRSEPATWSRLTPALAQRIKEELNSYKMEEMEVHAASRIQ
ncbi:hypothetical protein D9615_006475 [Tricholomella constricta]|uniref:Uncharacterized protein n=1 Tax=Tricholomella constricta TaxID=117010 RepID=A0A8H5H5Q2_9AGAR|nr:hypothetical protein D9615_006475 [Tricholomella constricta]